MINKKTLMKCQLKLAHANSEKIAAQFKTWILTIYRKITTIPTKIHNYSPINLEKITLSKDENHEKTWFSECINKKTMKKRGFCEPRFFKIALTDWIVCLFISFLNATCMSINPLGRTSPQLTLLQDCLTLPCHFSTLTIY
jgi:hypothetical protein